LYLAARIHGIPRMVKEFSIISGVSEKSILRCCMKLRLGLRLNPPRIQDAYISRFVKSMNLDGRIEELANTILDMAKKLKLTQGRSSRPMAAAAIYIAARILNVRVAQRKLARIAGISPVTLRKRYKEILKEIGGINRAPR
ncbi:MAG: transcription initiation factor IIB, partial [Thaumarchaeota archaeon]